MRIIECCNTVMIQSHGEPITKVLAIRVIILIKYLELIYL